MRESAQRETDRRRSSVARSPMASWVVYQSPADVA